MEIGRGWKLRDYLCYFSPAVSSLPMDFHQMALLFMGPALLVDVRPQFMVPSLPQLLANSALKFRQQLAPAAHTMLLDQPGASNYHFKEGQPL